MMGNADLFHTYNLCSKNFIIHLANGSMSKVVGIWSIFIIEDLALKSILLVPNLTYNLLSISKLTDDLIRVTNFYSTHYEFQELESGRMIDNARECVGLFFLEVPNNLEKKTLKLL